MPIPSTAQKQSKLAWRVAEYVSSYINADFCGITLTRENPEMKDQSINDKIKIWSEIYADETGCIVCEQLEGKNILIIDDLYQSGASVWCFAEYLKRCHNVQNIVALSLVKSQRDGDNL